MRHIYENKADLEVEEDELYSDSEEDDSDPESEEDASDLESKEDSCDTDAEEVESDSEDNEETLVANLQPKLLKTLQKLKAPTAFACSAVSSPLPSPGLYLPRHGVLGLPLSSHDARIIISEAKQSPFGKGEKTVIDTTIRKSWELNPNEFSLKNPGWNGAMKTILDDVCFGLGVEKGTGKVSAKMHKLLLYEPGAFFTAHKDSEKASGMFGTLVICLPSPHEGGKLILTHHREKYEFDTAVSSKFKVSYAAWFADITHEIQPVISGYRLILVYNLIRQTDFKIPSYDVARGHAQKLLKLLKLYSSRLEERNSKLPPFLLHRLKHKYTHANLQLKLLKPQDFAHVQTLAQISTELGFTIYLATLDFTINTCDEGMIDEFEHYCLENVVELDGKLVVKLFEYKLGELPDGALIDPTPMRDENPDGEEHEGPTGNEGSPATYWYKNTVAILLPPSKQMDFVFTFSTKGKVIMPLFCRLMQEFAVDPAQKPKLEKLCEAALNQKSNNHGCMPPFFKQALDTALDLGRIDLLGKACKSRGDEILFKQVDMLGLLVANNSFSTMRDQLIKCVQSLSSVAKMFEFSQLFSKSYEIIVEDFDRRLNFKQWLDEVVLTAVSKCTALTQADGVSLGQMYKTIDWRLFKSEIMAVMLKAGTMVKISFINEFISTPQLGKEQKLFAETIVRSIWKKFFFNFTQGGPASRVNKENHSENDMRRIIKTSVAVLPSECVETTIIPAMLSTIPNASKDCSKELFPPLAHIIVKNKLGGFRLSDNAAPPSAHKRLVQALLTKFLIESVGSKPRSPKNWSLSAGSCNCDDCSIVNKFLQDPVRQRLDFPCKESRRNHLYSTFGNSRSMSGSLQKNSYDIETLPGNPKVWRITKHLRKYQNAKSEWKRKNDTAVEILSKLKNDEPVKGRLEAYLQPYYSVIMNATVEGLPDIQSWATTQRSSERNETGAPNETALKREGSNIDFPAKRSC